jgi:hypothetical protein
MELKLDSCEYEYWHCAFLMYCKCAVWLPFNVNVCALLLTIELKWDDSFQSEYMPNVNLCALLFITLAPP